MQMKIKLEVGNMDMHYTKIDGEKLKIKKEYLL